jgi:large subunit ribosomal protein L10
VTLKLEQKKAIVAEVALIADSALSVVAADYRGLTVSDMTALRAKARKSGVHLRVVRNTLARQAFKGTPYECLNESLVGPVLLAFAKDEPSASARLLRDFAKTNDKLKVKALSLNGLFYGGEHLESIARLPTREEGITKLVIVMQAPITKFVRTMAEPAAKFVRVLAAIRDQKQ